MRALARDIQLGPLQGDRRQPVQRVLIRLRQTAFSLQTKQIARARHAGCIVAAMTVDMTVDMTMLLAVMVPTQTPQVGE